MSSTTTKDREALWGIDIHNLELDSVPILNSTNNTMVFEPTNQASSIIFKSLDEFYRSKREIERYFIAQNITVESTGQATENMRLIVGKDCESLKLDTKKLSIKMNATHSVKMCARDFFRGAKSNKCMFNFNLQLNETSNFETVILLSDDFYKQMESFQINFDTKTVAFNGADFGEDLPPVPPPEPFDPENPSSFPVWGYVLIALGVASLIIGVVGFVWYKRKQNIRSDLKHYSEIRI